MLISTYLMGQTSEILKLVCCLYIINKTHLLNNLIMLEYMTLIIVSFLLKVICLLNMEFYISLFVLILMITESIIGLSLLISMLRTHSNDFIKSSAITKF